MISCLVKPEQKKFIDLFSGCGGLSLGLMAAGWQGLFAVEINRDAFQTLSHNLIKGNKYKFNWIDWLPQKKLSVSTLIKKYKKQLESLRGKVDLVAGGPPCQGFSTAGRRNPDDRRNKLTGDYLKVVELVRPKFVLLENVSGFTMPFHHASKQKKRNKKPRPYSDKVKLKLEELGYTVYPKMILSSIAGVPQSRARFFMLAIQNELIPSLELNGESPFQLLETMTPLFKKKKKLPVKRNISVYEAISDLEVNGKNLVDSTDSTPKGFKQIHYVHLEKSSSFQRLMRQGCNGDIPNSLRLAKHKPATVNKFRKIHEIATPGVSVPIVLRELIGIKKHALTVLHPGKPSSTITTVPEDVLHYSEYRILTVRENARLQSFPDWFEFQGKYTTGGQSRKKDCPRYTQVANAVPPLLAELLGNLILDLASRIDSQVQDEKTTPQKTAPL
jgi:DNA (cytosine-5)-methyltransferase 1